MEAGDLILTSGICLLRCDQRYHEIASVANITVKFPSIAEQGVATGGSCTWLPSRFPRYNYFHYLPASSSCDSSCVKQSRDFKASAV